MLSISKENKNWVTKAAKVALLSKLAMVLNEVELLSMASKTSVMALL